ncbi:MAG: hypothetical protein Q8R92_16830 [Deltaproteobacteria bacterium]|nr:hypothetical protein [Deltaproteobacteria bacterium]
MSDTPRTPSGYETAARLGNEIDLLRCELSELREDAAVGRKWRTNSSLEEWFPLSAEEIVRLRRELADAKERITELINEVLRRADSYHHWRHHFERAEKAVAALAERDEQLRASREGAYGLLKIAEHQRERAEKAEAALAAEWERAREECARVCESRWHGGGYRNEHERFGANQELSACASAIRVLKRKEA